MSGSSVIPAGSNRMFVNFSTYVSSGTPYCSATDTAIENASITPARVDPCLPSLRNTSPRPSPGYDPAVMYPSAPATLKEVVTEVRWRGSRLRTALAGAAPVVDAAAGAGTDVAEVDPPDSGWPTLRLSRYTASALMPIFQALK